MPTATIHPTSDVNTVWSRSPLSGGWCDHVDEGWQAPDTTDYIFTGSNGYVQKLGFGVPSERDIDVVTSIRVYLPYYGALGASADMRLKVEVYGNGVLIASGVFDSNTDATIIYGYVDLVPTGNPGQAAADAIRVDLTHLGNYGGSYPPPEIYEV